MNIKPKLMCLSFAAAVSLSALGIGAQRAFFSGKEDSNSVVEPEVTIVDYRIQSGETLSGIARDFSISTHDIMKENPHIKNPNVIRAGDTINVPVFTPVTHE